MIRARGLFRAQLGDGDAEPLEDRPERVVLALGAPQVDGMEEAVRRIVERAAERGARTLDQGLAQRRRHALRAEPSRRRRHDGQHRPLPRDAQGRG